MDSILQSHGSNRSFEDNMRLLAFLLMLGLGTSALAEEAVDSARSLLTFIYDVTSLEGMYYSVHDYCAPFVHPTILKRSERDWNGENGSLLTDRDSALDELIVKSRMDSVAVDKIKQWKAGIRTKFHDSDTLYKDIASASDMDVACSKRLGVMASDSMRFQRIAPASYAFWKSRSNK